MELEKQGNSHTFALQGSYTWNLIFDIDNRENSGVIRKQIETRSSLSTCFKDLTKVILKEKVKVAELDGKLLEIVDVDFVGEFVGEHELKQGYESLIRKKRGAVLEKGGSTDIYEVGANCHVKLHQLVFKGPGVCYVTDTVSTKPFDKPDVTIRFTVKPLLFLQDIEVIFTEDATGRPLDALIPASGKSANINAGFGGYAWLVPVWTTTPEDRVTGFHRILAKYLDNPEYINLTEGACGPHVHLKMIKDPNSKRVITKVGLFRRSVVDFLKDPLDYGWQFKMNINKGRCGLDNLYICWNTQLI